MSALLGMFFLRAAELKKFGAWDILPNRNLGLDYPQKERLGLTGPKTIITSQTNDHHPQTISKTFRLS